LSIPINITVTGNEQIKELDQLLKKLKKDGKIAFDETGKAGEKAKPKVKKFGNALKKISRVITGPLGLTAGFAGLGFAIKGAIGNMVKFQTAMAEVSTLIDTSTTDMGKLNDNIVDLSTRVPQDAVNISKGLYQTISAGITDVNDALFVTEVATKAATGGLTDTNTAVDAITTVLNAYQKSVGEANDVSDVLFQTVKDGKTRFGELAQGIGTVASSAALAGVKFRELGAAIATITKFGVNTELAVTALNRLFLQIATPTDALRKKAKDLHIEFNIAALRAKGFAGFMKDLTEKFGDNQNAIFDLGLDIRAFRALSILGGTGAKEFGKRLEAMGERAGATETAFKKMNKTTDSQFKLFKNKFNAVLINLGDVILPAVNTGLDLFLSSENINATNTMSLGMEAIATKMKNIADSAGKSREE